MTKTIPDVATFLESPDLQNSFKKLHKEDLILLAEHFKIEVTGKNKPEIYSLVEKKLIDEGLLISTQYNEELETPNVDQNLQMQLELKKLELQALPHEEATEEVAPVVNMRHRIVVPRPAAAVELRRHRLQV